MLFVILILNLTAAWDVDMFKQSMKDLESKLQESKTKIEKQMDLIKQITNLEYTDEQ